MKKKFDAVAWMRKRRAEIDRETEGLSWEEATKKIEASLKGDPLWEKLRHEMVSPEERLRPVPTKGKRATRH